MSIEVKVPMLPESVADATVAKWYKKPGDTVKRDENLVDLETDKVMLEVPAPEDGILKEITKPEGSIVKADELLAILSKNGGGAQADEKTQPEPAKEAKPDSKKTAASEDLSPAVRRLVSEHNLSIADVKGSGKEGRIVKEDVLEHIKNKDEKKPQASAAMPLPTGDRPEKRVPMSRLRAKIAERLVEAQHTAAMLTTFNEINMQPVMEIRAKYKDQFEKTHKVRLGFMSFFVKAAVEALKRFPAVNASIDGQDIVYHGYYDIGIAVSSPRGLVVPVLRNVDMMSMAQIEATITDYANKAKEGKLTLEEMTGGTFTITNGGIFGSLMSTPIINPPQSGILGMHNIVQRPVVENEQIVIRPMMYVALSYDHRIIDGRESVSFLVTIKQLLEDPSRILLEL
ncbi:MAG: 2-oxoglutarate dehydrogenase complex dihydrolipoyllysine-residue succinyltransferase [Gammaproteobacteria bacterium]|nr:2-oxoglutarate dehydrogenase complex dihydrolipoyllysine-residue succinyltransferase [Gammaproteobacteria bacterium]